ncbi:hypothetical protein SASPL_121971 [Salvia splendens]|uniref:Uncharacterized protein n=1 Tax=Salvia splendens TaxID=180675 RepID=A0A8X8ZRT5_SALSN|nr:hypothetical protein SASPL_121971 [Salvia splendens]
MKKEKSPVKTSPVPASDQESGSIGNAQAMNKTLSTKKRRVLPTDQERRSVSVSTIKESLLPIKKRRKRSNVALRIVNAQERNKGKGKEKEAVETAGKREVGNARVSEIERKGMQERHRGKRKKKEAVETAGMEVRNPTKKQVEDDDRRVTAIIKTWTSLQWNATYSSTKTLISNSFCMLEFKHDLTLRNLLRARDESAVEKDGLFIPTVDDKGRTFDVVLKQSGGYLMLTGEGWSELVRLNMVEMRSVFQIYSYREGCLKFEAKSSSRANSDGIFLPEIELFFIFTHCLSSSPVL